MEDEARKCAWNLCALDKKPSLAPFRHLNRLWKTINLVNRSNILWRNLFIYIFNCFLICVNDQVMFRAKEILEKNITIKKKGNVLLYKEIVHDQSNEREKKLLWNGKMKSFRLYKFHTKYFPLYSNNIWHEYTLIISLITWTGFVDWLYFSFWWLLGHFIIEEQKRKRSQNSQLLIL